MKILTISTLAIALGGALGLGATALAAETADRVLTNAKIETMNKPSQRSLRSR